MTLNWTLLDGQYLFLLFRCIYVYSDFAYSVDCHFCQSVSACKCCHLAVLPDRAAHTAFSVAVHTMGSSSQHVRKWTNWRQKHKTSVKDWSEQSPSHQRAGLGCFGQKGYVQYILKRWVAYFYSWAWLVSLTWAVWDPVGSWWLVHLSRYL